MTDLFNGNHAQGPGRDRTRRGATRVVENAFPFGQRQVMALAALIAGAGLIALSLSQPPTEVTSALADPTRDTPTRLASLPEVEAEAAAIELSPASVEAAAELPPPAPKWREEVVGSGDNLSLIFARAGFSDRDVYQVTRADNGKALRRIYPGETIAFLTDAEGKLDSVRHVESPLRSTTYSRDGASYSAEVHLREPEVRQQLSRLRITSSLFLAGQEGGLSGRIIMDLAGVFGGVIDFALDPRVGDTIELVFEENYLDGEKLSDGEIVAAAFTNKGETFEAFRYTDAAGDTSYYNREGVSMRKAFLKAPVDFTRVSSNFNPNRLHPIYKTKRPHRGTDYAAPTGTPVYASGDGRVVEAGYTRPNGNYVFIQHGETFKTHYLHLHRLKVKRGQRVKQGDVIGTVGSTGAATGPHLHYEFLVNGVHRNPRTVHRILPKAKALPAAELDRFQQAIGGAGQQLATLRGSDRVALAQ